MKISKLAIIYILISLTAFASSFTINKYNPVTLSYFGFGIDSIGNLYVGKYMCIEKIKDNKVVETIIPPPSRNYAFTIKEDDTILLSTASKVYSLDLHGNVISQTEYHASNTYNKLKITKKHFTSSDGQKYVVKHPFGRTTVRSSEGEIIYQMPMTDYIVRLISVGFLLSTIICVPIIMYKWKLADPKPENTSPNKS